MPQARPSYNQETMIPSVPPSRQHTQESQTQTRILPPRRQFSSPASAYNSALPDQQHRPQYSGQRQQSSSELPYAYDGVASVASSAAPIPAAKSSRVRNKPSRPKVNRQDSDPPLKSAMRTPGVRRPERKATINDKTATIRPKPTTFKSDTTQGSVTNDFLSDWLTRPPPSRAGSNPYQEAIDSAAQSRSGSVFLPVPHPKDRPIIKRGGLAPAPPPRARTKSSTSRSTESGSYRSGDSALGLGYMDRAAKPQHRGLGARGPSSNSESGGSVVSTENQGNTRWANRLRERR